MGICKVCGKDFRGEGDICSPECEAKYRDSLKITCDVCGRKIDLHKEIIHHVSYDPEQVIYVHPSCHQKIHKTDMYPDLKPNQENKDYHKAQIRKRKKSLARKEEMTFQPDEEGLYYCPHCKRGVFFSVDDLKSHLKTHKIH